MDKRYQVFVSSTYEDLQEERKEVMQALLELDCIPAGMELFPASNNDQWTLIKNVIDDCDYYILIIGGRYGSTNEEGKSYTQMEFEYALSQGKPIISFLHKNPENISSGKSEQDADKKEKLAKFKELAKQKLIKYWDSPENLGSVVSRSMVNLIKTFPAVGWVKSDSIVNDESIKEIARLQKENQDLKAQIDSIATEAPKGTENLSQGDESVLIEYTFTATNNNDGHEYVFNDSWTFSWNELFMQTAPCMIFEESEEKIKEYLNELISDTFFKLNRENSYSNYCDLCDFEISTRSFNLIKIQFRALGLLELIKKPKDETLYWKLSPYGDFVMTQTLAIKRNR